MIDFTDGLGPLRTCPERVGNRLAADIGVSATSVSKIVTRQSKPKQFTLTRLIKRLCTTVEKERIVIRDFAGLMDAMPDEPLADDASNVRENEESTRGFLEVETQSIQFKRSVARELDKAGIEYQQDYCEGIYSTDFLIEKDGKRIAVECKANVGRDLEKARAIAELLMEELGCRVHLVTPYISGIQGMHFNSGVKLFPLSELLNHLMANEAS